MKQQHTGNLLMVSNYPSSTAYAWWLMEHFWVIQSEYFTHAGKSTYLAYPQITTLPDKITNSQIQTVELSFSWRTRNDFFSLLKFIKENKISNLYLTDQPYFSFRYLLLRFFGVKHVVIHDHTPGDRPPVNGLKGFIKSLKNNIPWLTADYILCVSELMRQRNISNARLSVHKCIVVQNGIKPIICSPEKNKLLLEKLNIAPECIKIVTSGRAHPYKRFDFIIECANIVKSRAPDLDIVFILIGDGPAMPVLQKLVQKYQLESLVHLLGFRNDVHDLLCSSDIALHAALGEGFSLSIIEYMSAGLPVLVPDIPSVSQATKHNETGFIYSKDDTNAVANYILSLAADSKNRTEMGNKAKLSATSSYSLDRCTSEFMSTIELIYSN